MRNLKEKQPVVPIESASARTIRPDFVPKDVYISPEVVRLEREKFWPRVWQVACREEELKAVGDFVTYDVAGQSIVVVRVREGQPQGLSQCLPTSWTTPGHGRGSHRQIPLQVSRLAVRVGRHDLAHHRPRGLGRLSGLQQSGSQSEGGPAGNLGGIRVHQHGSERRAARRFPAACSRIPGPVRNADAALSLVQDHGAALQLEDGTRSLQRGLSRLRHASPAARVHG